MGQAIACASCGCSLNSDWGTQGISTSEGWSIDVHYDYLNQNQLRSGTGSITPATAAVTPNPYTPGTNAEVEQFTKSLTLTSTLDYNNGDTWGVSLVVPTLERIHSTLGTGSDGFTGGNGYSSSTQGIGDIRLIGRYFGMTEQRNFGLQYGLKLPTGNTTQVSNDGNSIVDPGLQLGTGTTDLILGAYYYDNFDENWEYFGQAMLQTALNYSTMAAGSYRPGDSLNLNVGIRNRSFESFIPTLQINSRIVKVDQGDAADTFSTGGKLVYLTPGVIIPLGDNLSTYASVQLPIYQNVNGIQLTPSFIFSAGMRFVF